MNDESQNENEYLAAIYVLGDLYAYAHGPTPEQAAAACVEQVRKGQSRAERRVAQQWLVSTYRTGGQEWSYWDDRGVCDADGTRLRRHLLVVVND